MKETQAQIAKYQALLPHMREKLAMVAMLFIMSAIMLTSATFAWVVLSTSPEVSGMTTTITSNGNLEIALVDDEGNEPGASAVGDSKLETIQRNITWGNLVNLSDEEYGLENFVLRPAQLNRAALLTSPLYGAEYGKDGRITKLTSNFDYTKWIPPEGNVEGYFGLSSELGVRAIASTKVQAAMGFMATYLEMREDTIGKNQLAVSKFIELTENKSWMETLAYIMGVYMQSNINSGEDDAEDLINPSIDVKYLNNLVLMYEALIVAHEKEAEALASLVNLQLYLINKGDTTLYTPYTLEALLAETTTENSLLQMGVRITDLNEFKDYYAQMLNDIEELKAIRDLAATTTIKWMDSGLKELVNNLVYLNDCIVRNTAENFEKKVVNIGVSAALTLNNKSGSEAIITNGVLWEFERRTGAAMQVGEDYYDNGKQGLKIVATGKRSFIKQEGTVYAIITTNAYKEGASLFAQDLEYTEGLNTGTDEVVVVAQDTYGLAVDLWVRTNASAAFLTLEGNVLTESETVRATGKDASGNVVELYTVSRTEEVDGESVAYTMDLYKVVQKTTDTSGQQTETVTWYSAESHRVVTEDELGDATPIAKMVEIENVIGYEGENRIWAENALLSTDSTTQGSGSCYVYYADTPEDQARSLELMDAFNVAFISDDGNLLATATMDTAHHYAVNGRVIVPLTLGVGSINLGQDISGNSTYAITALEKNVPTRITAIVYLDGTKLTNQEVMAASNIQGQLNIQFGCSEDLNAIGDEKLENAERVVSATVDQTTFDYDTTTSPMTTNVTINVGGDEPDRVTAFFVRAISSTQGTREEVMTFTKGTDGNWISNYTFTSPGVYVLRTVQLDGMSYDLANPPTVTVNGFAIKSLICQEATDNQVNIMTAANSTKLNLSLQFAATDIEKLPTTVIGRYLRTDGTAVNVEFKMNANQVWSGEATIQSSGEYTLEYLILDGEYVGLDENFYQKAVIYLGMKAAIYTTSPTTFKFLPDEMTDAMKNLGMRVEIMDNTGKEMEALANVWLYYTMQGSGTRGMSTELTWNEASGYYEGEFHTDFAGIFKFSNITVGSNTITEVTTAPTFTILSPQPPEYYAASVMSYQYVPDNTGKMSVQLAYSASAATKAIIRNTDTGEEYESIGSLGSISFDTSDGRPINEWLFTIPVLDSNGEVVTNANVRGEQDGNWQLDSVEVWNAYDTNGNLYTEASPLVFELTDKGFVTKVVSSVKVVFTGNDLSQNFGVDSNGTKTSLFMTEHTISGLHVDIKDFEGMAIQGIKNVKLVYTYGNDSSTYGSYTSKAVNNTVADFEIPLEDDGTGIHFAQNAAQTIQYAGSYEPSLSYTVSVTSGATSKDTAYTATVWSGPMPEFTVSSKAPSVTIKSISPTSVSAIDTSSGSTGQTANGHTTNVPTNTTDDTKNKAPGIYKNGTEAWVYYKCTVSSYYVLFQGTTYYHSYINNSGYNNPSVTITLSDLGSFTNATLSFSENKYLYTKVSYTSSGTNGVYETTGGDSAYSWTKTNSDCMRYVGYCWAQKGRVTDAINAAGKKTPAGTITANTLAVTYKDDIYNFTIPTITINNPY